MARRRTAAALPAVLLAVTLTACGGGGGGGEAAHRPVEASTASTTTYTYDVVPTDVVGAGLPPLTIRKDVVIDSVSLGFETGSAELIRAMVSFVACKGCPPRRPSVGYPTVMGGLCTDVWPTHGRNGLGPAYPAKGITLHKREQPSIVLYLRAPAVHTVVNEVVVRYTAGDQHDELHWQAVRLDITPKPKGATSSCSHDSIWWGGDVGADKVTPLR
jgi:hypothetical protein